MRIFDAVYTAAVFLGLDKVTDVMADESFDKFNWKACDKEIATEIDLLLRCCNLVIHELSDSDFPLVKNVKLKSIDGRVTYNDFPDRVLDVITVKSEGKSIPFHKFFDCIIAECDGVLEITYAFEPTEVMLAGAGPHGREKPSARLVSYGIAREYCLISGRDAEASIWDGRFVACVAEEAAEKRERRVKRRAWR